MIKQTLAVLALSTTFAAADYKQDVVKGLEIEREVFQTLRNDAGQRGDIRRGVQLQAEIDYLDKQIDNFKPAPTKQINNNF